MGSVYLISTFLFFSRHLIRVIGNDFAVQDKTFNEWMEELYNVDGMKQ
jgi:hypothetical protein